ncbi:hypothetical protein [Rhodococcus sp. BS-15]|uniref:hypothetical protein n=1 Tax=Rhodococcus sp. BS-15 TaxID=1304954 RepID=UPI000AB37DFB|nr:hypothetical protein [Rhodococcus sp. BS-15]
MTIYVYLDVDIDACRECASALRTLGGSAEGGFERFRDARDRSEDVWKSGAGDSFRDTISTLSTAAEQTADRAPALAQALDSFAASMCTARESLNRAIARAMETGIWVGPDVCNATWIGNPDPLPPTGPWSIEQLTTQANQIAAYNDAVDMVIEARTTESNAHTALQSAFDDSAGWLDRLRSSAPWMAAGGAISYLALPLSRPIGGARLLRPGLRNWNGLWPLPPRRHPIRSIQPRPERRRPSHLRRMMRFESLHRTGRCCREIALLRSGVSQLLDFLSEARSDQKSRLLESGSPRAKSSMTSKMLKARETRPR